MSNMNTSSRTPNAMIELHSLTKQYGSFCAVSSLSFSVNAGEIFGFLGVNGAGKTTTLRMLAGILQPSSGHASLGGFDIMRHATAAKSLLGFIPDRPHLYAKLTGREFLLFVADLHHVAPAQAQARIDQLLEDYGLTQWEDELVESYSHGMKQRLATCGALVHKPKILIVDEPMVGLDPHGAKLLKESLRRYASEGMCILLSTHSLNVAQELCHRLAIINQGRLLTVGTLDEVRHRSGEGQVDLEKVFLSLTASIYPDEQVPS